MLTALSQYIPLQNGQSPFIKEQALINDLLGIVGYEVKGEWVVFTEDITAVSGANTTAVDMQLVVMDLDKYGDYDLLPLTADMAEDIVREVAGMLMQTPPADKKVDSMNEQTPDKR